MRGPDPTNPTLRKPPYRYRLWRGLMPLRRIEARCVKNDMGCWLYPSVTAGRVYAYIDVQNDGVRQQWMAHRYTYALARGEIPEGFQVCHKCDIGHCVNPDHLWIGTQAQNLADRDRKFHLPRDCNRLELDYPPKVERVQCLPGAA